MGILRRISLQLVGVLVEKLNRMLLGLVGIQVRVGLSMILITRIDFVY